MKIISRPINWSLVLVPLLVSALAFPGNAYSQQSDRVSKQQDYKRRVGNVERSKRKAEPAAAAPVARQRPANGPRARDTGARAAKRDAAPTTTRHTPNRSAAIRPGQQSRGDTPTRPNASRPSSNRSQQSRVQTESRDRRGANRASGAPPAQRAARQNQPQRIVPSASPRRPVANREAPTSRPANGPSRVVSDQQRRYRESSDRRYGQNSVNGRNTGYRDNGNRGHGSQSQRTRQPNRNQNQRHQEQRVQNDRQRANRYFAQQARQRDIAAQRARILQQQRRASQYRYQNQYRQRLQAQHVSWNSGRYNYYSDPFYSTPANYRYQFGGQWHTTNRYGANLMQQAVDYGYQEGLRAGQADRQDGWRADYRNNFAYEEAGYGYNGRYISPPEYQHYFRQGFQRGYQDGYGGRHDYGYRRNDGSYAIIAGVLAAIVGLQLLN